MPERNGKYTDFTIVCGGQEFNVDKVIICSESQVFEKEIEHHMQESSTNRVLHKEFDATTVDRMLDFIYKGTYELPEDCEIWTGGLSDWDEAEHDVAEPVQNMPGPSMPTMTDATAPGHASDEAEGGGSDATGDLRTKPAEDLRLEMTENTNGKPPAQEAGTSSPAGVAPDHNAVVISGINAKLVCHARMYAIGDYYAIPKLQAFAKCAFKAESGWQLEHFTEVISEVNRRPGSHDRGLRDELRQRAEPHLQDFVADMLRKLAPLPRLHAAELLDERNRMAEAVQARDESIEGLRGEVKQAEEELKHVKEMMDDLEKKVENLPLECPNRRCSKTWDPLTLSRKHHWRYGNGGGAWEVRCKSHNRDRGFADRESGIETS
ncbi:hypothetical protein EJ03DRAFT_329128 [Teratosphaeria nubilosa]|uniref:BTB domain-containing protein n=1 Tax=Teratosphaeria nubilosa TaxID=161662 RepID=A0A6G1L3V1_9PEZI|nr:hypothetical protein EJ03DRAFT_329128 [Teratosphaeria nubilosa]